MANSVPTKASSMLSPDTAMLFAPFRCPTHLPCPTLSAGEEDIAGSDITS